MFAMIAPGWQMPCSQSPLPQLCEQRPQFDPSETTFTHSAPQGFQLGSHAIPHTPASHTAEPCPVGTGQFMHVLLTSFASWASPGSSFTSRPMTPSSPPSFETSDVVPSRGVLP